MGAADEDSLSCIVAKTAYVDAREILKALSLFRGDARWANKFDKPEAKSMPSAFYYFIQYATNSSAALFGPREYPYRSSGKPHGWQ